MVGLPRVQVEQTTSLQRIGRRYQMFGLSKVNS